MDLSMLNRALDIKTGKISTNSQPIAGESVVELEIDKIKADPNQPRKTFNAEDIQSLADDIKSHGLIQPIIVRADGIGQYIVVAGERRLRAFQLLKEPKIKAIIRNDYSTEKLGFIQIAENIKRSDLKFYELAEFIVQKLDSGIKQVTLADELGLPKTTVMQYASWKDAPEFLKEAKEKFSSIRGFYDLVNLCQEHESEVKEFLNSSEERISRAAITAFKKKLNGEEEPEPQIETSQDEQHQEQLPTDDGANDSQDGSSDDIPGSSDGDAGLEPSSEDGDSSETFETSDFDSSSSDDSAENQDTEGFEDGANTSSTDFSSNSDESEEPEVYQEDPEQQSDELEDQADAMLGNADDEEKLKRPLIIGTVEGREGYLLYKRKPSAEGMLWIKWEDGFEEEIIAESFRINRITEE